MSAKNAVLKAQRSHYVSDDGSGRANGISKEEVYLYFLATWRGKPVAVTMSCDRYSASVLLDEETYATENRLTDWRTYASEAHYHDPEKNGGRGESVSGTARSALGKLCEPLVMDWLQSEEYTASFQRAVARLIMRKFRDDYSASARVTEALATFRSRMAPKMYDAISAALDAYNAYEAASAAANEAIKEEGE